MILAYLFWGFSHMQFIESSSCYVSGFSLKRFGLVGFHCVSVLLLCLLVFCFEFEGGVSLPNMFAGNVT